MRNYILFIFISVTGQCVGDESIPCSVVKEHVDSVWEGKSDSSASITWIDGNFLYFNPYLNKVRRETYMHFSHFDIDNNGTNDTVIRRMGGIGGEYGDSLTIALDQTIDLSGGFSHSTSPIYDFGESTLYTLTSYPPWPYESQGIFLSKMVPLFIDSKVYLVVMDTKKQGYFVADYSKSVVSEKKGHIISMLLTPECGKNL